MPVFLKQLGSLLAGQMAGSNNKATFIVKTLRTAYISEGSIILILWYAAWRNERVAPGEPKFPFPGIEKLKRQFPADREEKELDRPASIDAMSLPTVNAGGPTALLGPTGLNLSPTSLNGPQSLNKGIAKASQMSGKYPYVWGGGHGQIGVPSGGGYDCSGAVSAVLGAMGLLSAPLVSGSLAMWGEPGEGNFVTIYANAEHTFMKININGTWRWFGTGSAKKAIRGGPAWGNYDSDLSAYSVRHPKGY